jgi:hypothetical protein
LILDKAREKGVARREENMKRLFLVIGLVLVLSGVTQAQEVTFTATFDWPDGFWIYGHGVVGDTEGGPKGDILGQAGAVIGTEHCLEFPA